MKIANCPLILVHCQLTSDYAKDSLMNLRRRLCVIAFVTIAVVAGGCQPLSTKRAGAAKAKSSQTAAKTPTKADDEAISGMPASPQDSLPVRRKIPTLREQMDRLQNQQELTNTKIDSLQIEVGSLRREIQNLRADMQTTGTSAPKQQGKTAITKGDAPKKEKTPPENDADAVETQPSTAAKSPKKEKARVIMPDAMTGEAETATIPKKKKTKTDSDVILPDNGEETPSQPTKKKTIRKAPEIPTPETQPKKNKGVFVKGNTPESASSQSVSTKFADGTTTQPKNATADEKETPNPAMLKAKALFDQKKFQEAYTVLEEVATTEKKPDVSAQAYYWMGEAKYGLAKYDEAIKNSEKVIQLKSKEKSPAALILIAKSQAMKGNKTEAKKYYLRVQKQFPKTPEAAYAEKQLQQL